MSLRRLAEVIQEEEAITTMTAGKAEVILVEAPAAARQEDPMTTGPVMSWTYTSTTRNTTIARTAAHTTSVQGDVRTPTAKAITHDKQ